MNGAVLPTPTTSSLWETGQSVERSMSIRANPDSSSHTDSASL